MIVWMLISYLAGRKRGRRQGAESVTNAFNRWFVKGVTDVPKYMNRPSGAGVVNVRNPRG